MAQMKRRGGFATQAVLASALLSLLTLGVFFLLQDYGPESAVRRFHQAALADNDRELQRVTDQSIRSSSVKQLREFVSGLLTSGAKIQIGRVERSPSQVLAEFRYYRRDGVYILIWYVKKTKSGWAVDAERTLTSFQHFMGRLSG